MRKSSPGLSPSDVLNTISAIMMGVALFLVFLVAPQEKEMGNLQRVFYFHVSSAWVGYLVLLVAFVASVLYLACRNDRWDDVALASVEIGLVFMTQGIITGAVWAKATWGVWWTWEPRLTTSAVLWVIYASYLTLRRAIEEQDRQARLAAVYSIIGSVSIPVNLMAIRWWRTVHPLVFEGGSSNLEPAMLAVLIFCVVTFTFLYFALLGLRLRLAATEKQVQLLKYQREM